MKKKILYIVPLLIMFCVSMAWADPIDNYISYNKYVDVRCNPCIFKFSLWDAPNTGNELWTEEGVELEKEGKYISHYLGSSSVGVNMPVPLGDVDFSQQMWVQTEVRSDEEQDYEVVGERDKLEMVPYSFYSVTSSYAETAGDADTVDGKHASEIETQLQNSIDAEEAARIAADNAEAITRATVDEQLQNSIDAEEAARASADTALQDNLNTESAVRADADAQLQQNIDNEVAARVAADNALQQDVNTAQSGVTAEQDARIAADIDLQSQITAEEAARASADTALQDNLNTESAVRADADAQLQAQIDGGLLGSDNEAREAICELYEALVMDKPTFCPYAIGDRGPAGGIVFYITDGGLHGLEAATEDQSSDAEWGCNGTEINGADGTAVGTGAQNTADILAGCSQLGIAAEIADNYSLNGYEDWFLPSKDELNLLYQQRDVVGGFVAYEIYWSSTEENDILAWSHWFVTNMPPDDEGKLDMFRVRAVRAF